MLDSFRMLASSFTDTAEAVQHTSEGGGPDVDPETDLNNLLERRSTTTTTAAGGVVNPQDDLQQQQQHFRQLSNSSSAQATVNSNDDHDVDLKHPVSNNITQDTALHQQPLYYNSNMIFDTNNHNINNQSHFNMMEGSDAPPNTPTANPPLVAVPPSLVHQQHSSLCNATGSNSESIVSRRRANHHNHKTNKRRKRRRHRSSSSDGSRLHNDDNKKEDGGGGAVHEMCSLCLRALCLENTVKNTLNCMNILARIVVWSSVVALAAGVVWYSYELTNNGTDPHLIAWFSAGAFVLLGFPLSMGSIVAHLANYNQPHVQCYIVRILWMVPLYSMESWLCLRFHEYAIYIETLRDCYESFVLYSFLQFLIQVLGGEEALILMLKDKSPTRGSHMWGMQWCIKPWLMGQPVRRSVLDDDNNNTGINGNEQALDKKSVSSPSRDNLKRVHWKSPFFVKCKFGVLQYVLLKFVCSIVVMILELHGLYKEGDFTPKGGYLYICFITNISQCWALYCMILFYYATHNELSPIRPVGKFLSVKALVFFTWWQSVGISILYQMDMIPHYNDSKATKTWSSEDVAKGIQDYLICVEMFFAAIVHTLVFPHSEYSPQAVQARARALNQSVSNPSVWQQRKRLGRHHQFHNQLLSNYRQSHQRDDRSATSGSRSSFGTGDRSYFDLEMTTLSSGAGGGAGTLSWDEPATMDSKGNIVILPVSANRIRTMSGESYHSDLSPMASPTTNNVSVPVELSSTPRTADDWDDENAFDSDRPETHQPLLLSDGLAQQQDHDRRSAPPSLMQPSLKNAHSTIDEGENEDSYMDGSVYEDDEEGDDDYDDEELGASEFSTSEADGSEKDDENDEVVVQPQKHNFVRAFLDSAIPRDLRENTVGIVRGDYVVEKKTLLHHATTSDHYDLFSHTRRSNYKKGPSPTSKQK